MSTEPIRTLAPDLWVADRPLSLVVGDVGTRMTVVRLPGGGLFLHSPVRLDAATRQALDALGPVRAVVAPSKVHHFFAGDYPAAYPEAKLYQAPGLAKKRPDLRLDGTLGDEPAPEWRGVIDQHLFQGASVTNEVVFFHRPSRTLILTDLAYNVPKGGLPKARFFVWLMGADGRFGPHRMMRLGMFDRAAARRSVEHILSWDFDRVTVAHGEVLETGGRERLREAFRFLGV